MNACSDWLLKYGIFFAIHLRATRAGFAPEHIILIFAGININHQPPPLRWIVVRRLNFDSLRCFRLDEEKQKAKLSQSVFIVWPFHSQDQRANWSLNWQPYSLFFCSAENMLKIVSMHYQRSLSSCLFERC